MVKDIKEIAEEVLYKLDAYTPDALALVMRTGYAESGYKVLKQYGGGPALGFWQVEPTTAYDTVNNYVSYRPKYEQALLELGCDFENLEFSLLSNIAIQVAFCRLKYMRDPNPIPPASNLSDQAKYWKRVYNTELGKGTVEHFIAMNENGIC